MLQQKITILIFHENNILIYLLLAGIKISHMLIEL